MRVSNLLAEKIRYYKQEQKWFQIVVIRNYILNLKPQSGETTVFHLKARNRDDIIDYLNEDNRISQRIDRKVKKHRDGSISLVNKFQIIGGNRAKCQIYIQLGDPENGDNYGAFDVEKQKITYNYCDKNRDGTPDWDKFFEDPDHPIHKNYPHKHIFSSGNNYSNGDSYGYATFSKKGPITDGILLFRNTTWFENLVLRKRKRGFFSKIFNFECEKID